MSELVVSEIFGPTFQGEGPSTGRLAMFVRLGRCNLDCSWCDTPYTWDWDRYDPATELETLSVGEVIGRLDAIAAPLLVITGGEPLAQQRSLGGLLDHAARRNWRVEIETNGTMGPSPEVAAGVSAFNVSPKLANSGIDASRRIKPEALRSLTATGRAHAKFVVVAPGELDEVAAIVELAGFTDVWIMPEATSAAALASGLAALAPAVLGRGWNLSSRLHVQLWGDARGV
ncbi:MAG: 7-carboxy-7-deazaguanine synthase QueE [Acidimicrobiales bacterium]